MRTPFSNESAAIGLALGVALLAASLAPTPAFAAEGPTRVVVVPSATLGDVREIFVKRINKKIRDVLAFGGRVKVLTDNDTPPEEMTQTQKVTAPTKAQLQLSEADRLRLEGMDLATNKRHKPAYRRFLQATQIYEKYFYDLVDYNNMADAYARAALSAFHSGQNAGNVRFLFTNGLALQPTLVIDRRRAPKDLLELFDALVEGTKKAEKHTLTLALKGGAQGATAFVDGHRVGALPGSRAGLLSGYHYVQVRSPNHKPWGKQVRVRGKPLTVTIKLSPIKQKTAKEPPKPVTFEELGWCANTGNFSDKKCRALISRLGTQTGASYVLFSALKADRYGRLSVHAFIMQADGPGVVAVPPIELQKNLGDLNAKMPNLEEQVSERLKKWPKKRVMRKQPSVFK